jgi:hypothetical protein
LGLTQEALRQFDDKPDLFGKCDKHVRRGELTARCQRASASNPHKLAVSYIHQRLEKRNVLVVPDADTHSLFQLGAPVTYSSMAASNILVELHPDLFAT